MKQRQFPHQLVLEQLGENVQHGETSGKCKIEIMISLLITKRLKWKIVATQKLVTQKAGKDAEKLDHSYIAGGK